MQPGVEEFLSRRLKKTIAEILGSKERDLDPYVPEELSRQFRKTVLDSLNRYHDVVVDAVDMVDTGTIVINEEYLTVLEDLRDYVYGEE